MGGFLGINLKRAHADNDQPDTVLQDNHSWGHQFLNAFATPSQEEIDRIKKNERLERQKKQRTARDNNNNALSVRTVSSCESGGLTGSPTGRKSCPSSLSSAEVLVQQLNGSQQSSQPVPDKKSVAFISGVRGNSSDGSVVRPIDMDTPLVFDDEPVVFKCCPCLTHWKHSYNDASNVDPSKRFWIGPTNKMAAFLFCIPLNVVSLALSLGFLIWGCVNIAKAVRSSGQLSWDELGDIIVGIFKAIIGLGGLYAAILLNAMGVHMLFVGYNVFFVSVCVDFISQWLEWIMALSGNTTADGQPWQPTHYDKVYMSVYSVEFVVMVVISVLFVFGLLNSLKMVLAVGGTGYERKNFLTILAEQEAQAYNTSQCEEYDPLESQNRWKRFRKWAGRDSHSSSNSVRTGGEGATNFDSELKSTTVKTSLSVIDEEASKKHNSDDEGNARQLSDAERGEAGGTGPPPRIRTQKSADWWKALFSGGAKSYESPKFDIVEDPEETLEREMLQQQRLEKQARREERRRLKTVRQQEHALRKAERDRIREVRNSRRRSSVKQSPVTPTAGGVGPIINRSMSS